MNPLMIQNGLQMVINEILSKCENGGTVSWNDTNKSIALTSKISDKCYVYFDVYSASVINSFTYTTTKTSLTITAKVTKGSHDISKYYFSINNGNYNESSTNTYTFSNLSAGTTYTIKVKTKDSLNKESSVYSATATTTPISLADYCISGTKLSTCIKTFANQKYGRILPYF